MKCMETLIMLIVVYFRSHIYIYGYLNLTSEFSSDRFFHFLFLMLLLLLIDYIAIFNNISDHNNSTENLLPHYFSIHQRAFNFYLNSRHSSI
jgi:hypothetical protein